MFQAARARLSMLLPALVLYACSGSDPYASGQPSPDGSADPEVSSRVGDVLLYQVPQGDGWTSYVVSARFGDADSGAAEQPDRVSEACELRVIEPSAAAVAGPSPGPLPGAGRLAIQSASRILALEPDALGVYSASGMSREAGPLWDAAKELVLSAEGGEVPAFGIRIRPPSPLALRHPFSVPRPGGIPGLSRSRAAAFSWEPSDVGTVHVQLSTGGDGAPGQDQRATRVLECTWPASDGYGEIASAALACLPGASATVRGYVHASAHAPSGAYAVTVTLVQEAVLAGVDAAEPLVELR